jgi:hypothetical protein
MASPSTEQGSSRAAVRLRVELSPELYSAILERLGEGHGKADAEELIASLETHLGNVIAETLTEAAGAASLPPPEVHIVPEFETPVDEDEPDPVEGFSQAWHDAMIGNTHPASILWDDRFWDSPDAE